LEDYYLKYTEVEPYKEIVNKINLAKEKRNRFIKSFIKPLQEELKKLDYDFEIKGRPKSVYSIWNKMKNQNIPLEEIYDLFAIRIILDAEGDLEKQACWQVYSIVTDYYTPNPDRLRDWISTPKSNGYESLHTTVMSQNGTWVEVQIRTKRMDEIAERGYAAHWKYKDSPHSQESGLEKWINKVRDMLEQNDTNAIEFVDDFKSNLFNEEVFAFTPKGELKILPVGATALDFAFEIHTEIGARCLGAKVNQKLVPLNYVIKNGDQIEILTSPKQKPKEDWLRFVVSSKAKTKIKDTLKESKKEAARDGREIVLRKLKQIKLEPTTETFDKLRTYFNAKTQLDLFYKVGKGLIVPSEIKKFRNKQETADPVKTKNIEDANALKKEMTRTKGKKQEILLIGEDMDIVEYRFAKCCNPIPGDDVFGFVTVSEGIKIHRTSCLNAPELLSKHGQRVVKAKWASKHESSFLAGLGIIGTDRVGLINDVTKIISNELKVNMRSITVDTDTGIFEGNIQLYVNDTRHLDLLIHKLMKVNGVVKVSRFNYLDNENAP
jgi:GTP pyrophosphokinase